MRRRTLMQEKFCDTVYIDQRDNSTRLVYGDVNGQYIRKIVNSARNYLAKNLGNGEVIATEVTGVQLGDVHFIANGESIGEYDPRIHGDSFVMITIPVSFKCVEIEPDLFRLQWLADHKPDDTWKEVPVDTTLFGSNFIQSHDGVAYGSGLLSYTDMNYTGYYEQVSKRGKGYSIFKYAFTSMFKILAMCVYGYDKGDMDFMRMSRIITPPDVNYQEVLSGAYIIPNGNTATFYATDIDGNNYEFETPWDSSIKYNKVKKLHLSENIDMIPKEYGNTVLYNSNCWLGGSVGKTLYVYSNGGNIDVTTYNLFSNSYENEGTKAKRCRLMFQGKINYTQDIDYYLSLPNN